MENAETKRGKNGVQSIVVRCGKYTANGQALYLAERVDAIVLQAVSKIFEQIRDTPYSRMAENRIRQESNLQKSKRASVEKKIKTAQHALERFEGEILKCLDGTSNFTEDMIAKQTSFCLLLFYLLLKHWNHPLQ